VVDEACGVFGGGGRRSAYRVLEGRPEERKPLERCSVDWTIILKWICKKRDEFAGTSLICQWIGMDGRVF